MLPTSRTTLHCEFTPQQCCAGGPPLSSVIHCELLHQDSCGPHEYQQSKVHKVDLDAQTSNRLFPRGRDGAVQAMKPTPPRTASNYAQSKSKEQAWHLWCCDYSLYKAIAPLAVLLVWIMVENYVLARGCTNNTLCAHTSLPNFSKLPLNSIQEKHACIEHPRRLCTVAVDTYSTVCSRVVSCCNQHCHQG